MDSNIRPQLFMVLIGCKPPGRFTEQHDIYFGVGNSLANIKQGIIESWPEVEGHLHIDAWRAVKYVDNHEIKIETYPQINKGNKLYFINLGGYTPGYFAEPHYMMLIVAPDKASAIKRSKETEFYKNMGFAGATSHIDDKYALDVDDIYELEEILNPDIKSKYSLHIIPTDSILEDELHLGYLPIKKLI